MVTETLSARDIEALGSDRKVGLLATRTPDGLPHTTLITTLEAKTASQLVFGQFSEGRSKAHVQADPRVGWLVMSLRGEVWRGRARWAHLATEGEDYERFNDKPLFRYNSYFGIHTVHYLDLVDHCGRRHLPLVGAVLGLPLASVGRLAARRRPAERVFNAWTKTLLNHPATLKFLTWLAEDGYPRILPLVPAQVAGDGRLVLGRTVHRAELRAIPDDTVVNVFALNLKLQSVLVRGRITRLSRLGVLAAKVDVDWVYNTMPPKPGRIYPPRPLEAVTEF